MHLEQAKAVQDRAAREQKEAELLHDLGESMDSAQRSRAAQTSLQEEHQQVQESLQVLMDA